MSRASTVLHYLGLVRSPDERARWRALSLRDRCRESIDQLWVVPLFMGLAGTVFSLVSGDHQEARDRALAGAVLTVLMIGLCVALRRRWRS